MVRFIAFKCCYFTVYTRKNQLLESHWYSTNKKKIEYIRIKCNKFRVFKYKKNCYIRQQSIVSALVKPSISKLLKLIINNIKLCCVIPTY